LHNAITGNRKLFISFFKARVECHTYLALFLPSSSPERVLLVLYCTVAQVGLG
jgi:hypothetical protein